MKKVHNKNKIISRLENSDSMQVKNVQRPNASEHFEQSRKPGSSIGFTIGSGLLKKALFLGVSLFVLDQAASCDYIRDPELKTYNFGKVDLNNISREEVKANYFFLRKNTFCSTNETGISLKWTRSNNFLLDYIFSQDDWLILKGNELTFEALLNTNTPNGIALVIVEKLHNDIIIKKSSYHTGDGQWQKLSVKHIFSTHPGDVWLGIYQYSSQEEGVVEIAANGLKLTAEEKPNPNIFKSGIRVPQENNFFLPPEIECDLTQDGIKLKGFNFNFEYILPQNICKNLWGQELFLEASLRTNIPDIYALRIVEKLKDGTLYCNKSAYHTGNGQWQKLAVKHTISDYSTEVFIHIVQADRNSRNLQPEAWVEVLGRDLKISSSPSYRAPSQSDAAEKARQQEEQARNEAVERSHREAEQERKEAAEQRERQARNEAVERSRIEAEQERRRAEEAKKRAEEARKRAAEAEKRAEETRREYAEEMRRLNEQNERLRKELAEKIRRYEEERARIRREDQERARKQAAEQARKREEQERKDAAEQVRKQEDLARKDAVERSRREAEQERKEAAERIRRQEEQARRKAEEQVRQQEELVRKQAHETEEQIRRHEEAAEKFREKAEQDREKAKQYVVKAEEYRKKAERYRKKTERDHTKPKQIHKKIQETEQQIQPYDGTAKQDHEKAEQYNEKAKQYSEKAEQYSKNTGRNHRKMKREHMKADALRKEIVQRIRQQQEEQIRKEAVERSRREAEEARKEAAERVRRQEEQVRKEAAAEQARRVAEEKDLKEQAKRIEDIRKQFIQDNKRNVPKAFTYFGLSCFATFDQVKIAFKQYSMRVHPDKGGSLDQIKQVNAQFEILQAHFRQGIYEGL